MSTVTETTRRTIRRAHAAIAKARRDPSNADRHIREATELYRSIRAEYSLPAVIHNISAQPVRTTQHGQCGYTPVRVERPDHTTWHVALAADDGTPVVSVTVRPGEWREWDVVRADGAVIAETHSVDAALSQALWEVGVGGGADEVGDPGEVTPPAEAAPGSETYRAGDVVYGRPWRQGERTQEPYRGVVLVDQGAPMYSSEYVLVWFPRFRPGGSADRAIQYMHPRELSARSAAVDVPASWLADALREFRARDSAAGGWSWPHPRAAMPVLGAALAELRRGRSSRVAVADRG